MFSSENKLQLVCLGVGNGTTAAKQWSVCGVEEGSCCHPKGIGSAAF